MKYLFLKAKAIENIHAGRSNESTDYIDKVIQRDISGIPCIENTAFKGALKKHCSQSKDDTEFISAAFGAEGKNGTPLTFGQYSIKQLDLLALPIPIHPCIEQLPSAILVTSWSILDKIFEDIFLFMPEAKEFNAFKTNYPPFRKMHLADNAPIVLARQEKIPIPENARLGNHFIKLHSENTIQLPTWLEPLFFNDFDTTPSLIVSSDAMFSLLTSDSELPLKHRNKIDWGESVNLWIEQFLPRGTRFITKIRIPEVLADKNGKTINQHEDIFIKKVDRVCIQVGANKSVGYGECYFEIIK